MWLWDTWNVISVTEELNFKFHFESFRFEESHMPSDQSTDLGSALSFQQLAQGLGWH